MNKINLLIIAPGCAPDTTGQALRVFNWINMVKDHVRVTYFSTYQQKDPGIAHNFYCQPFPDNWKSKVRKLWTYYKMDFAGSVKVEKPDIVQVHTPYYFGIKRLFPDIPVIFVEHNVNWKLLEYEMAAGPGIRCLPIKFPLVNWLKWRAKRYEKQFLLEAAHTFACSPVDRQEILKELPQLADRITVVPNSLDLSLYTPSEKRGENVLFLGTMTYSANLDAVDIICTRLAPRLPEIPFQIIGSGQYCKPYPPNVNFLGYVEDIKPYVADCRIFIVPLRFGSGTRFKILEAMAMNCPVISTPKGAEGLDVTHEKDIWIEEDWSSFADAIKILWNDPEKSKAIASGGHQLVQEKYDYRLYAEKVVGVYKKLVL